MIHAQSEYGMSILLILYPILTPTILLFEMIRTFGEERYEFAPLREFFSCFFLFPIGDGAIVEIETLFRREGCGCCCCCSVDGHGGFVGEGGCVVVGVCRWTLRVVF